MKLTKQRLICIIKEEIKKALAPEDYFKRYPHYFSKKLIPDEAKWEEAGPDSPDFIGEMDTPISEVTGGETTWYVAHLEEDLRKKLEKKSWFVPRGYYVIEVLPYGDPAAMAGVFDKHEDARNWGADYVKGLDPADYGGSVRGSNVRDAYTFRDTKDRGRTPDEDGEFGF